MPPCSSTGMSGVSSAVPGMGVPAVRSGASVSLPSSAEPAPASLVWGRGSAGSSLLQPHRPPGGSPAEGAACPQPRDPRGTGSAPRQLPWAPAAPRPSQPLCVGETKAQPVRRPEPRQEAFCLLGGAGGAGQTRHGAGGAGLALRAPQVWGSPPTHPVSRLHPGSPSLVPLGPGLLLGEMARGTGTGSAGQGGHLCPPKMGQGAERPCTKEPARGMGNFREIWPRCWAGRAAGSPCTCPDPKRWHGAPATATTFPAAGKTGPHPAPHPGGTPYTPVPIPREVWGCPLHHSPPEGDMGVSPPGARWQRPRSPRHHPAAPHRSNPPVPPA